MSQAPALKICDSAPRPALREAHVSSRANAALDRETERLLGAIGSTSRPASAEDKAAMAVLLGTTSFSKLSRSRKRQLIESLRSAGRAACAASSFRALDAAGLEPAELCAFVDTFVALPALGVWHNLFCRFAAALRRVDRSSRPKLVEWLHPPRANNSSFPGHTATLQGWWASRTVELILFLEGTPQISAEDIASFLFAPLKPIYVLDNVALPGLLIICFGDPSNTETHAYSRRVFLDESKRLNAMVKSPVEAIKTSWRNVTDPRAAELGYKKWILSRSQERALVEWIEREHVISGTIKPHEPKQRAYSTFEAMLQFDIRLPRMLALIAGSSAEQVETGKLLNGRPVCR